MQNIKLLDNKTINKIAAGEVVESPKSVVKELVENAIDAGATSVTIEIKEGGISYIRISDNGSGIPKDQVKTAFLRHATSKMSQIEDLEEIFTLGFRGEALASIAGVAQVEMTTKTKDAETGVQIEIAGGEIKNFQDIAATDGTTIEVKNLFFNVPARRKFLKKPSAESGQVSDLIHKLALGHPEVSLRYINNGTTMLHTAGNNDMKTAIFYVYGKEVANGMVPISYQKGEHAVVGLIGKPELARANRNYENLFINGRFIKNSVVASAVEDAYKTRLMVGKFPVFLLNFSIPPASVDVNVHPAKLEVRFKNDNEIYEFFYDAVSKALEQEILIPQVTWDKKETKVEKPIPPVVEQQTLAAMPLQGFGNPTEKPVAGTKSIDQLLKKNPTNNMKVMQEKVPFVQKSEPPKVAQPSKVEKPKEEVIVPSFMEILPEEKAEIKAKPKESEKELFFHHYKIIGQVFRTYWMVEQGDCMYLIDQHAAHERILFEDLMRRFREEKVVSQRLLTPLMLQLSESEVEVLRENLDLFQTFGFEVEVFGGGTFALKGVPYLLKEPSNVSFFMEILDRLAEQKIRSVYDMKLMAVATMACKAAVKGHDRMDYQEAEALIGQLLKLENPFHCPHGRPTIIEMTKYELEKKFKRIQD